MLQNDTQNETARQSGNNFAARLKELMEEEGLTHQKCADKIAASRATVTKYLSSTMHPDASTLVTISKVFGVSIDWLLGVSDVRSPDTNIISVCALTGLDEAAVRNLMRLKENDDNLKPASRGRGEHDVEDWVGATVAAEIHLRKRLPTINMLLSSTYLDHFAGLLTQYLRVYSAPADEDGALKAITDTLRKMRQDLAGPANDSLQSDVNNYFEKSFFRFMDKMATALYQSGNQHAYDTFLDDCNAAMQIFLDKKTQLKLNQRLATAFADDADEQDDYAKLYSPLTDD